MKKTMGYTLFSLFLILFFVSMVSCLGPGIITETGGQVPGPEPTPTPTPTSWYIQNVFAGDWSYQFYSDNSAVQTYKVTHQVFNNGQLYMKFVNIKTGFTNFNADGVIDMNTGEFFAQGSIGTIGDVDGAVEFHGKFATDTITDYVADQEEFFSEEKTLHHYTIQTIRYQQ
ncbi:MAG TPA: hypothetical protein P5107_04505 [Thermotogota bacterium]|nr:hypothetical protein [Thermotogota bacterium]